MPTVLDNAKEAGYAALGLQILFFEEMGERLSAQREQLDERFSDQREQIQEQLEIARKHPAMTFSVAVNRELAPILSKRAM